MEYLTIPRSCRRIDATVSLALARSKEFNKSERGLWAVSCDL